MNRKSLLQYLTENYTLPGPSARIIDAMLDMINIYGDEENKLDMVSMVLDEIGCTADEIKSFFDL